MLSAYSPSFGGAGEKASVSHAFHPSGLVCAANSQQVHIDEALDLVVTGKNS
jgi:hypothetical protein